MKLAIVGSRTFRNYDLLNEYLKPHASKISLIISGGAKGADYLAEIFAKENSIPIKIFVPDWDKYGKKAGYLRNVDIIKACDAVVAFWDGKSKGTEHDIKLADEHHKFCIITRF